MEKISNAVSQMTAGLAAIALTFAAIAVTVIAINLFGDALIDALDIRNRLREV